MGKVPMLIGQKFGRLTVIDRCKPIQRKDGRFNNTWKCQCDCGKTIVVSTNSLTSGNTKSCGCAKIDSPNKIHTDISGQVFNDLTAIIRVGKYGKTKKQSWLCKCICGNFIIVPQNALVSNSTKSCGCLLKRSMQNRIENLAGQKFGKITVISLAETRTAPSGQQILYWNCRCDCGTEKIIRGTSLKSGYATSCGCLRSEKLSAEKASDLSGRKFGLLTVVDRAASNRSKTSRHAYWNCLCECGKMKKVSADLLISGHTLSCGCRGRSLGETAISIILDEKQINYESWYAIEELTGKRNMPLRFDFAIKDNYGNLLGLIEYQGQQHYVERSNDFGKVQRERTDNMKREFCKTHNIILCEIRYDEDLVSALDQSLQFIYSHANSVPSLPEA